MLGIGMTILFRYNCFRLKQYAKKHRDKVHNETIDVN